MLFSSSQELNLSYGEITEAAALVVARAVVDKTQMEKVDLNGMEEHYPENRAGAPVFTKEGWRQMTVSLCERGRELPGGGGL